VRRTVIRRSDILLYHGIGLKNQFHVKALKN